MRLLVGQASGANVDPADVEELAASLDAFLDQGRHGRSGLRRARHVDCPAKPTSRRRSARDVDPDAVHRARLELRHRIGVATAARLEVLRGRLASKSAYSPDAASAGRRALRNAALDLIAAADPAAGETLARGAAR